MLKRYACMLLSKSLYPTLKKHTTMYYHGGARGLVSVWSKQHTSFDCCVMLKRATSVTFQFMAFISRVGTPFKNLTGDPCLLLWAEDIELICVSQYTCAWVRVRVETASKWSADYWKRIHFSRTTDSIFKSTLPSTLFAEIPFRVSQTFRNASAVWPDSCWGSANNTDGDTELLILSPLSCHSSQQTGEISTPSAS